MSEPLESFGRFNDFPPELRQAVWHAALDDYLDSFRPKLFDVSQVNNKHMFTYSYTPGPPPRPPIALVCHESRDVAKSYYTSCRYQGYRGLRGMSDAHWFRPEKDILYLSGGSMFTRTFSNRPNPILELLPWPRKLDYVRNVGMDYFTMGSTPYVREIIPLLLSRFPSLDTLYWLVPQHHWVYRSQVESHCCLRLPSDLMDIPDGYDDLYPGFFDPENDELGDEPETRFLMRWPDVRTRMIDIIREIREAGEIPREPKLQGMFIIRPECPGSPEYDTPCELGEDTYGSAMRPYWRQIPFENLPDSVRPHWGWVWENLLDSEDQQQQDQQPMT
ncbi:hypothetical protein M434DRAFT_377638 [Hypoxylon sp. CO27-5]|nr:hypothetical protein M434DRAFT_377638 [Hypoxylon sp. CO27-5]